MPLVGNGGISIVLSSCNLELLAADGVRVLVIETEMSLE